MAPTLALSLPGTGPAGLVGRAAPLAFAGFESAGSLGEESLQPRRSIPRTIFTAVGLEGVVCVIAMSAQTLDYSADAAGVKAFASAATLLNDLAEMYANHGLAAALDIGAVLSAVGAALGGVVVCSRMLLTMSRDRLAPSSLSRVSPSGKPQRAIAVEIVVSLGSLTAFHIAGAPVLHAFSYLATCGALRLLAMYVITYVASANDLSRTTGAAAVVLPSSGSSWPATSFTETYGRFLRRRLTSFRIWSPGGCSSRPSWRSPYRPLRSGCRQARSARSRRNSTRLMHQCDRAIPETSLPVRNACFLSLDSPW